jgi:hypothetical protein
MATQVRVTKDTIGSEVRQTRIIDAAQMETYSISGLDPMVIVTMYEALQSRRDQILQDLQDTLKTERCDCEPQDDEFMFLSTLLNKVTGIMYLLRTETKDVF